MQIRDNNNSASIPNHIAEDVHLGVYWSSRREGHVDCVSIGMMNDVLFVTESFDSGGGDWLKRNPFQQATAQKLISLYLS